MRLLSLLDARKKTKQGPKGRFDGYGVCADGTFLNRNGSKAETVPSFFFFDFIRVEPNL